MAEYLLPDVGEGLTEAEIVTWKVKVGDVVEINDIVVEIETAKSLVELPSPYAGTVTALLVPEGETVAGRHPDHRDRRAGDAGGRRRRPAPTPDGDRPVQPGRQRRRRGRVAWSAGPRPTAVAARRARRKPIREAAGERTARADVHDTFNQDVTQQHERVSQIVSAVVADAERQAAAVGAAAAPRAEPVPAPAPTGGRRPGAGQAAGAQARQGPRRRPRHADARPARAARSPARTSSGRCRSAPEVEAVAGAPAPRPPSAGERERREPIKGVRKMMARRWCSRRSRAPHVTEWVTVDATRDDGVRRAAQEAARVHATSRSRRCWCWPGR